MEFNVSVPNVGELTAIAFKLLSSASVSLSKREELPVEVMLTVPESATIIVSVTVLGASLTGVILTVTVAVFP